jgi:hypothetical protein
MDSLQIGNYSIMYDDLNRDGLPVQTHRRSAEDFVRVDAEIIGSITFEWEDKVTDLTPGSRTLKIIGLVRLVD